MTLRHLTKESLFQKASDSYPDRERSKVIKAEIERRGLSDEYDKWLSEEIYRLLSKVYG